MISLDLRRLERTALARRGVRGGRTRRRASPDRRPRRLLGERGFSLGHFPQSFQFATIGGFAATRSSGQDSAGYGRFNDMVRGLRAVTPAGVLDLGRAPESAAGPDLRQLLIGSEGAFGVITRVRVRGTPDAGRDPLRGLVVPRLRHRRRRPARRRPDRHRAQPCCGSPTRPRPASTSPPPRASARTASPAAAWRSPCSRAPRSTSRAGTPRPGRCWKPRAARRSARGLRAHGSTAASTRRTCATRCCRRARCARPWRRRPTGPTSPR